MGTGTDEERRKTECQEEEGELKGRSDVKNVGRFHGTKEGGSRKSKRGRRPSE